MANEVVTRKPIYEEILEPAKGIITVANRQTNIFEVITLHVFQVSHSGNVGTCTSADIYRLLQIALFLASSSR